MRNKGKTNYCFQGSLEQVQQGLASLKTQDKSAEKQVQKSSSWSTYGCLGSFVGFLACIFTGPFGLLLLGPSLLALLFGALRHGHYSQYDLEDMRYELPSQLLSAIAVNLDPEKPVQLDLDFGESHRAKFVTGVEQSKFLVFSHGPKVTRFQHPWLNLQATTTAGQKLKVSITRNGSFTTVPKRKRTKEKLRCSDAVVTTVRPARSTAFEPRESIAHPKYGLRSMVNQVTAQASVVKAVGPIYSRVKNRGTVESGARLNSKQLLYTVITAFRALH